MVLKLQHLMTLDMNFICKLFAVGLHLLDVQFQLLLDSDVLTHVSLKLNKHLLVGECLLVKLLLGCLLCLSLRICLSFSSYLAWLQRATA
jgi:hypothetical protein